MQEKEYLKKLFRQFKQANGIKDKSAKLEDFKEEFNKFIFTRQIIGEHYIYLLDNLNLEYEGSEVAETNKGCFDSVVIPYGTTLITPYYYRLSKARVIPREFVSALGHPILLEETEVGNKVQEIKPNVFKTFMTQNPYTIYDLDYWDKLHNMGVYNIIVGMYGNVYDKDKEEKLDLMRNILQNLDEDIITDYDTLGDEYFCLIGSKRNIKEKTLTLSR